MAVVLKDDGTIKLTGDSGCMFCDMGNPRVTLDGDAAGVSDAIAYHYLGKGDVILCVRNSAQTPRQAQ